MKIRMQSSKSIFSAVLLLGAVTTMNAAFVTVDSSTLVNGFMNVFNLPPGATVLPTGAGGPNGPANGAYQFSSSWAPADLVSSFAGNTLTLRPNQIGDPNIYWYQGPNVNNGGPGAPGNKIMDASLYNETTGVYVNQTLSFTGNVLANSLNGAVNPYNGTTYSSVAFIKDFVAPFKVLARTLPVNIRVTPTFTPVVSLYRLASMILLPACPGPPPPTYQNGSGSPI